MTAIQQAVLIEIHNITRYNYRDCSTTSVSASQIASHLVDWFNALVVIVVGIASDMFIVSSLLKGQRESVRHGTSYMI